MCPGLPVGGGVSTSPTEVERAPRGFSRFSCCVGDQRSARKGPSPGYWGPVQAMTWLARMARQSACEVGHMNWKIWRHHSLWFCIPSVPTGGKSNTIPPGHGGKESGHLDAILKQCLMKWENAFAAMCSVAPMHKPRSAQWTPSVI